MLHTTFHWKLLPYFILRQAGFPFEWLEDLESVTVARTTEALLEALTQAITLQRTLLQSLRDLLRSSESELFPDLQRALTHIQANVVKGKAILLDMENSLREHLCCQGIVAHCLTWNASLLRLKEYEQALLPNYSHEQKRSSLLVLQRFCSDQRLREVLLLSNEASFDVLNTWLTSHKDGGNPDTWTRQDKRKIDTLVMYLQRICAKNDTHAHFGPFSAGKVVPESPGIQWQGEGQPRRTTFFAHWAAQQIAQQMSCDPALYHWLRPRRKPGAFLSHGYLQVLEFDYDPAFERSGRPTLQGVTTQFLTTDEIELLQSCDGAHTIAELFTWWCQNKSAATWQAFQDCLQRLEGYKALTVALEIPPGLPCPLADLQASFLPVDAATLTWACTLEALQTSLGQFAQSAELAGRRQIFTELKACFSQLTNMAPVRGLGKFYVDRSILYEECSGNLEGLRIGGTLAEAVQTDLALVYDLFLIVPRYRLAAQRVLLGEWFTDRFGANQQVSLDVFLLAFLEDMPHLEERFAAIDARIEEIICAIDTKMLAQTSANDSIITVKPEDLQELSTAYTVALPAVCNPDIMVMAESAEGVQKGLFQILIGECHAVRELLSHTSLSPFLQDAFPALALHVTDLYQALLEDDEVLADPMRGHPDKTFVQLSLPCYDIEVQGRSPKPRSQTLALHELYVRQTADGLRLYSPRLLKFVRLMASPIGQKQLRRNPLHIFGFPRRYTGVPIEGQKRNHLPRIVMGRVIIQREMWRFPANLLAEPVALGHWRLDNNKGGLYLRAKLLQQKLKLPRYGFAKIPGETKPIYVDFDAPLLVRQFARLASHTSGTIEFSEMLPAPGQLWLQSSEGHHTTEFRFALFSTPETGQEQSRSMSDGLYCTDYHRR